MNEYVYIICILSQLILAAIVWQSAYMDVRMNRLYLGAIIANTLTLVGYIGRSVADDGGYVILNYLTNILVYVSGGFGGFFLLLTTVKKNSNLHKVAFPLQLFNVFIIISSPITKLSFQINSDGIYERGSAYAVSMTIALSFLIMWLVSLAVKYKFLERKKKVYILFLAMLEISAVLLQAMDEDYKVTYIGASFLTCIYYAFIMEVDGRYDQMTGVFSKRYYYMETDRLPIDSTYLVFMIDSNSLKKINDTRGHECGDRVIESVGQAVWREFSPKAKVFRTGGDEFVGISTTMTYDEIINAEDSINQKLGRVGGILGMDISVAIGYSMHITGEAFSSTLRRAEENMYESKKQHYEGFKEEIVEGK